MACMECGWLVEWKKLGSDSVVIYKSHSPYIYLVAKRVDIATYLPVLQEENWLWLV